MKISDLPKHCIIDIGLHSPSQVQKELHYLGYTWASGSSLLTLSYPNITCYEKVGNFIFYGSDLQKMKDKNPDVIVIQFENFINTKRLYED